MAGEAPGQRLLLGTDGLLRSRTGRVWAGDRIDAARIEVPHLAPHVMTLDTGGTGGGDAVRILVRYSCHCWSSGWDGGGPPPEFLIMDGNRARVFDRTRFDASLELPDLIAALPEIQVYVTRSERNYGCCRGDGAPVAREAYSTVSGTRSSCRWKAPIRASSRRREGQGRACARSSPRRAGERSSGTAARETPREPRGSLATSATSSIHPCGWTASRRRGGSPGRS